jgi:hypothetical protein
MNVLHGGVINLILALLIVLALGYAIRDALARSLAADDRSAAHRRADEEGFSGQSERSGSQGVHGRTEYLDS